MWPVGGLFCLGILPPKPNQPDYRTTKTYDILPAWPIFIAVNILIVYNLKYHLHRTILQNATFFNFQMYSEHVQIQRYYIRTTVCGCVHMGGIDVGAPVILVMCHALRVCQLKITPVQSVTMAPTYKTVFVFHWVSILPLFDSLH